MKTAAKTTTTRVCIIITVVFFLLNLILVLNHEPWADEANPWQIAESLSPANFFEIFRTEPHPVLWYIILAPFAKPVNTIAVGIAFLARHHAPVIRVIDETVVEIR